MKKFVYEKYDYAFLYGLLTEAQEESLQKVLDKFIGYPNTEATRHAVEMAVELWLIENNISLTDKYKIEYE